MTIGVDLGDKFSQLCVLDDRGEVVETARIKTNIAAMRRRFEGATPCRVVIDVSTHSPWVQRLLEELSHEVITAHTRSVRLIYGSTSKDDRLDAERLARLARVHPKLLHPIPQREGSTQVDRGVVRSRQALAECRTRLVNHARGMVKSLGGCLPTCSTRTFHKKIRGSLPRELKPALVPVLETIAVLTLRIQRYERPIGDWLRSGTRRSTCCTR